MRCPAFTLQARERKPDEGDALRVGFTCSKKVGNAVARNLAKRRLRVVADDVLPLTGKSGFDYVFIGRPKVTAEHAMAAMKSDLRKALAKLHGDIAT